MDSLCETHQQRDGNLFLRNIRWALIEKFTCWLQFYMIFFFTSWTTQSSTSPCHLNEIFWSNTLEIRQNEKSQHAQRLCIRTHSWLCFVMMNFFFSEVLQIEHIQSNFCNAFQSTSASSSFSEHIFSHYKFIMFMLCVCKWRVFPFKNLLTFTVAI